MRLVGMEAQRATLKDWNVPSTLILRGRNLQNLDYILQGTALVFKPVRIGAMSEDRALI